MYITDYIAFIVLYSLAWCAYIIVLIDIDLSMRLLRALNNMLLDSVDMPSSHEPVASSVCVCMCVRERKKEREKQESLLKIFILFLISIPCNSGASCPDRSGNVVK